MKKCLNDNHENLNLTRFFLSKIGLITLKKIFLNYSLFCFHTLYLGRDISLTESELNIYITKAQRLLLIG